MVDLYKEIPVPFERYFVGAWGGNFNEIPRPLYRGREMNTGIHLFVTEARGNSFKGVIIDDLGKHPCVGSFGEGTMKFTHSSVGRANKDTTTYEGVLNRVKVVDNGKERGLVTRIAGMITFNPPANYGSGTFVMEEVKER